MRYHVFALMMIFLLPTVATAGYKEEFEKEFLTKTWAGQQIEENLCISCHSSDTMKPEFRVITDAWQSSWHAQNNISCEHCHGGDPKDASLSMSPHRGFVGSPQPKEVPEFCGKCHIGILSHFMESGHGKALAASQKAPNCVTCHGAHNIQKATIDIINEQLCTKCHAYERAKVMKQALFLTEKKFAELDKRLQELKREGIYSDEEEKGLFNIQAEFRTLFHTVDVNLVKERTDGVTAKLDKLDADIKAMFRELNFRKNFSAFLMLVFSGMGIIILVLCCFHED
ncbi:MAG: cytochrome C [Nitrospirae bacterium]|nr:cytochrome C [Nitrospirota bacterium]